MMVCAGYEVVAITMHRATCSIINVSNVLVVMVCRSKMQLQTANSQTETFYQFCYLLDCVHPNVTVPSR